MDEVDNLERCIFTGTKFLFLLELNREMWATEKQSRDCLYLNVTALKFTCENMNLSINLKHIYG